MSSESSDDYVSQGVCSQDSNANVPSSSENIPILEFAGMRILDNGGLSRWRTQDDSDYVSDCEATSVKRKYNEESKTKIQQKKRKMNEAMEIQEVDSELPSETSDESEYCEADNEEEEEPITVEESDEECDGACVHEPETGLMDDEPILEVLSATSLNQPSTSGMKRKARVKLVFPGDHKLKKSSSNPELNF